MDETQSLAHTTWECKYHIVWIPKYRRKVLYGQLRRHLGPLLRELARQRECLVEEGHLQADHVHMLLSVPPKYAVAQVVGFIKGKSAIHIARTYLGRRQNFTGEHFWARGSRASTFGPAVSTVGNPKDFGRFLFFCRFAVTPQNFSESPRKTQGNGNGMVTLVTL